MSQDLDVVIVGGGFGGIEVARALKRLPVRITLVDRRNHHLFQPLLYQVATSALSAVDVAEPLRKLFSGQKNVHVHLAEACDVDTQGRRLILSDGALDYDLLVLAAGATNNYFGNDDWEMYAPGLKTLEDALEIRRRVLLAYEQAEREPDPEKRRRQLTFVVIGGGPTGVEMAGALKEIATNTLARDFRSINTQDARVILVEGGDQILAGFPEELIEAAEEQLRELGVEVWKGERVQHLGPDGVQVGGEVLAAQNVVWGAGVRGEPIGAKLGVELARGAQVPVNPDLTVPGHEEIFAIGDLAHFEQGGKPLPGVAPVAIQQGRHVARNIRRRLEGKGYEPFVYFDKGSMATIGRSRAVAITGYGRSWPEPTRAFRFTGLLAWLAWLFVHIMYLAGFRNRFFVFLEWAYAYFSYQRSARVILSRPLLPAEPEAPKQLPSEGAAPQLEAGAPPPADEAALVVAREGEAVSSLPHGEEASSG